MLNKSVIFQKFYRTQKDVAVDRNTQDKDGISNRHGTKKDGEKGKKQGQYLGEGKAINVQ